MKILKTTLLCGLLTFVATHNASGQTGTVSEWYDFPTTSVFAGINFSASLNRLWRLGPFVEMGQHAQFSRGEWYRRIDWSNGVSSLSHYNPSLFTRSTNLRFGTDVQLTASDHIRFVCHYRLPLAGGRIRADEFVFLLGYVRKQNLTQRMSLDLSILYGILGSQRLMNNDNVALAGYNFTSIETGLMLNFSITENLNLNFGVRYLTKLSDTDRSLAIENVDLTRNIITAFVGLHYRIQLPVNDMQPRQRVAPRHRALPCPPNQQIRQRHWDRPPTEFNHPSNPRRNR